MSDATFVLSLDTEIAWADAGKLPQSLYKDRFNGYQDIITRLIDLLDTYQIPATWAIVGALLLNDMNELDVEEPIYSWSEPQLSSSAIFHTLAYDTPHWYHYPQVLEFIQQANVEHEIGTHTFTHVYAEDPATTQSIFDSQLSAVKQQFADHNIVATSIIFPRNEIKYLEVLSQHGINAYRGVERNWYHQVPGQLNRIAHYLDRLLAITPPTYDIETLVVNSNLINLPSSQFLLHYDGIRNWIPTQSRVLQAKRGINSAIKKKELYHLWFHPHNLGSSEKMFTALEQILEYVAEMREQKKIKVKTMKQVADGILSHKEFVNGST